MMLSQNKLAFGLDVQDGAVRAERRGIITGFLAVSVAQGSAYEITSETPLEIDVWEPSPRP